MPARPGGVPVVRGLPRTALRHPERTAAQEAGRDLLQRAALATHTWPAFREGMISGGAPLADRLSVLERLRYDAQLATRGLTERLLAGSLSRDAWQRTMRQTLLARHQAAALAAAGTTVLDAATRQAVEATVRRQLGFLARFRADIAVGQTPLDGRALVRADLYGAAVWATGQEILRTLARRRGLAEERAIRHALDSCETCLDRAARGWAPLGTLVPIGSGVCRTRCQCTWSFR